MLKLIKDDPWLAPYEQDLEDRLNRYKSKKTNLIQAYGQLEKFATAYSHFGLHEAPKENGWWYREWAPNAHQLYLTGDFNQWDRTNLPLQKNESGVWEVFIPNSDFKISAGMNYKVVVHSSKGMHDRLPAYAQYTVQDQETKDFTAQIFENKFEWSDQDFELSKIQPVLIYEVHIGMAQETDSVGTYKEFEEKILPRIKKNGYNCIQLMAIHEHPYYGSFGYHVSSFFAPSSRFGTPDELRSLINTAHQMGIAVIMDIVHSHGVKNVAEGLNEFDGTAQYFHELPRGYHEQWDSMCFNYGKEEVLQFLLSNIQYWIKEFHFDGFRFDGVTSMLYFHHGNISFDNYDAYFNEGIEWDAITYLQLANDLAHTVKPNAILIAEDMSGMPGLCRKIEDGGIGFDYRLAMGIPDYWIKTLKHKTDEDWQMEALWQTLINRRENEKTVAYAESHDQAIVGDKSIAFWLMDKEMYTNMSIKSRNHVIDRGLALHKMIRLITLSLGGESYMNFIGNEFGHPEWVDFPREGNNWSHHYARRQWSLADNKELCYQFLYNFDESMLRIAKDYKLLDQKAQLLNTDEQNKCLMFKRGDLIFAFNFSPEQSIPGYKFYVPEKGTYQIVLNSDRAEYGGFDRIDEGISYISFGKEDSNYLKLYLPNRVALVLKKLD